MAISEKGKLILKLFFSTTHHYTLFTTNVIGNIKLGQVYGISSRHFSKPCVSYELFFHQIMYGLYKLNVRKF